MIVLVDQLTADHAMLGVFGASRAHHVIVSSIRRSHMLAWLASILKTRRPKIAAIMSSPCLVIKSVHCFKSRPLSAGTMPDCEVPKSLVARDLAGDLP